MRLASWNVNGIRASVRKGFLEFLDTCAPDILGIQEIKAKPDQIAQELAEIQSRGYHVHLYSAERPGYSGTALITKTEPLTVMRGMDTPEHDTEGRVLTAEYDDFFVVTVYTPNSKRGLERLEYRQVWDQVFFDYCKSLENTKPVIICGDLNVAHKEIDLARPKQNHRSAGFTDEERTGIQYGVDLGFIDTFRHVHPDKIDAYTWWSYFGNARAKNVGWRIDYFLCSPDLASRIHDADIMPDIHGSDHCPVLLTLTD